jgi:hypothetical protein
LVSLLPDQLHLKGETMTRANHRFVEFPIATRIRHAFFGYPDVVSHRTIQGLLQHPIRPKPLLINHAINGDVTFVVDVRPRN